MQKSKISILVSILVFTFTFNLLAQTDEKPLDLSGKWALQFQIDRYFTLSDFQGGTISGKYHFSNSSALRFGVTLGYEAKDVNIYSKEVYSDTTEIEEYDGDISSSTIQLNLQYLHYLEVQNSISAYFGAGIYYLMSPESENITDYRIYDFERSSYGLNLLIGVEWFVRSNIGIHAEYGVGFGYTNYKDSYERPSYYSDDEMNKNSS